MRHELTRKTKEDHYPAVFCLQDYNTFGQLCPVQRVQRVQHCKHNYVILCLSQDYPDGIRVGLVFRDIWGDFIVSDRQDKSMSRASFLFWKSAVRWWRASCKTLGVKTKTGGQRHSWQRMVAQWLSYRTTEPLTTAVQRPCRYAAAELVALFQSAPLPSSAPHRQGRWRAHTLAVRPSVSSIHYWPPKEWQLQPRPAPCALLTVPTHIKVPQYKPYI